MKREHKKQLTIMAGFVVLFCLVGVVLLVLGIQRYPVSQAFLAKAQRADGTVVDFERWDAPGANLREDILYAVVLFKADDGREIRFQGPSQDGLESYRKGDKVGVLYDPANPQEAKINSFMGLWFGTTMLSGFGAGAILIPLLTLWQSWLWFKKQEDE